MPYADPEERRKNGRKYYAKKKTKRRSYMAGWIKDNPDKRKNILLKHHFGISLSEYVAMFVIQKGICAICPRKLIERHRDTTVDHDHENGAVRGLLCRKCNGAIGLFDDDVSVLESAIKYLKKHGK